MEPGIKKVLVPIDFSDYSKNSLKFAVNFIKCFQAELFMIYVIATRSHMRAMTARLWEMNRTEVEISTRGRAIRSRTSASTVA